MSQERRKSGRKAVKYPVWIDSGDGRVDQAVLADVSETGARVQMPATSDLPGQVSLRLSKVADLARTCDVVWNEGGELGLRFEKRAVNPHRKDWVG